MRDDMSLGAWVKTQWRRVFLFDHWGTWFRSRTILRPRWIAFGMYVCFMVAGVIFTYTTPFAPIRDEAGAVNLFLLHFFLIVGSAVCLVGCIIRRPLIEAAGIPILLSSILAYGTIAFWMGTGNGVGNAALLLGVAFGLSGRLWELVRLGHVLEDMADRGI